MQELTCVFGLLPRLLRHLPSIVCSHFWKSTSVGSVSTSYSGSCVDLPVGLIESPPPSPPPSPPSPPPVVVLEEGVQR